MPRYVLELAYKGTAYQGWQLQKNTANTVQRVVNEKLSVILQQETMVMASGRTDAGVHARQNFAHFDFGNDLPADFIRRINFMLPPDISIRALYSAGDSFNARFDAVQRRYQYLISYEKNPLLADICCYYPYPELSTRKLNKAAAIIRSQDDFAAFSKRRTRVKTSLCEITRAHWQWDDERKLLRFDISANRFLRGMVRAIVATSVRYAREKLSDDELLEILISRVPHRTDFSAPPQGLTLMEVVYPRGLLQPLSVRPAYFAKRAEGKKDDR